MNTQAYVISCPHCGTLKMVVCPTNDWIDTDYILWSDGYLESKQWKGPAYTQKCNSCGKFFTLPARYKYEIKEVSCEDTGFLDYRTLKSAIIQLAGDEMAEARARLEAWWAYNILSRSGIDVPREETEFNHQNMQWLLRHHSEHTTRFSHLVFELNRLLGNKSQCEKMVEDLTFEQYLANRQARMREKGIHSNLDEKCLREMYDSEIEELKSAISKPLIPYKK